MNNNIEQHFHQVLFATLIANMPVDTRNMVTSTSMIGIGDNGTHWVITITGPSKHGDYARHVNYNRQRGPKEIRNFKYVERCINHVSQMFGGVMREI